MKGRGRMNDRERKKGRMSDKEKKGRMSNRERNAE